MSRNNRGPDTGGGSDKPKPREITSIEDLTPVVQEALHTAVSQLTDPITREMEEPYVDIPKALVRIDANINIPGMAREEAMEAALTAFIGERYVGRETDASDDVYVVQYIRDATAIILSKVLKTAELIRLASGSIAMSRKSLSQIPGSTLSVVGGDDELFTEASLGPVLKKVFLGHELELEMELKALKNSTNKPPLILLTCWFRDTFNRMDQSNLEFLCNTGVGWVFRIREESKHFLFQTDEDDSAFLKGLRLKQYRKIDEALS